MLHPCRQIFNHRPGVFFLSCFMISAVYADESIPAFSGIDYFSGRLVPGIGFGFQQFLDEKQHGDQTFTSNPVFYFRFGNNAAFTVLNETSVRKVGATEEIQYNNNPVGNRILGRIQWRPFSSIQIYPFAEFYSTRDTYDSHYSGDWHEETDQKRRVFGLEALALTNKGQLTAEPQILRWMHYVDSNFVGLSPGQIWISLSGTLTLNERKNHVRNIADPDHSIPGSLSDSEDGEIRLDLRRGFSNQMWMGCLFELNQGEYRDKQHEESILFQTWTDYTRWRLSPVFMHQFDPDFYHKANFQYINTRVGLKQSIQSKTDEMPVSPAIDQILKVSGFSVQYQLNRLLGVQAPDAGKVLANYQGLFSNRLNQGGWCFSLGLNYSLENIKDYTILNSIIPSGEGISVHLKEGEIDGNVRYGFRESLECCLKSTYRLDEVSQPDPYSAGIEKNREYHHRVWINTLGFSFGNYSYGSSMEQYKWDRLSSMDQLNGAMLSSGMIRLDANYSLVVLRNMDKAYPFLGAHNFYKSYSELIPTYINNMKGTANLCLMTGLPGNLMFEGSGSRTFYDSDLRNSQDSDWSLELVLTWQPWNSLRFSLCQLSRRFVPDQGIYTFPDQPPFDLYLVDTQTRHAWKVRITGVL